MASQSSYEYYGNLKDISRIRAIAETVMSNPKVREISISEAYELALKQPGISETDLLIYPPFAKKHNLLLACKVL